MSRAASDRSVRAGAAEKLDRRARISGRHWASRCSVFHTAAISGSYLTLVIGIGTAEVFIWELPELLVGINGGFEAWKRGRTARIIIAE